MDFFVASGVYSFSANFLIGLFVLLKNPKQKVNQLFALFSFSVGGWSIGSFLANVIPDKNTALLVIRWNYLFGVWTPALLVHFVYTYSNFISRSKRIMLFASYAVSALLAPLVFTPWFIPNLQVIKGTHFYISSPGPIYFVFAGFFALATVEILSHVYVYFKNSYGISKIRAKHLMVANSIALLAGFEYFSRVFGLIHTPPFDDYLLVAYFLVVAYSIMRSRLFDIGALADAIQTAKLTALGVIAASINHEIRNPLYVIKGLAETLAERAADPLADKEQVLAKAKEIADKTIVQSDRVLGIIKSFSSYAKRETDKVYEKQRVRVKEIVEHILPFVESELSLKKITIVQNIPEGLEAFADVQSLEEIFINLIVNACQAMPDGGEIKMTAKTVIASREDGEAISTTRSPRPNSGLAMTKTGQVLITIQDTGPGISPEQSNRIFEPFYTTKTEGTGLGLYVVKQLVEKNGGKVDVQSTVGMGTTFSVFLPAGGQSL